MIVDEPISNHIEYKYTSSTTHLNFGGLIDLFEILLIEIKQISKPCSMSNSGFLSGRSIQKPFFRKQSLSGPM